MKKQQYTQPLTEAVKMRTEVVMLPSSPGSVYNPAPARPNIGAVE